jgi:nicotinate-nucleotide adenylyltransferase
MGRGRLVGRAVGVSAVSAPIATRPGSIGIMGGTFDPIHLGHLAVAEEARESLGLERILFVPAGVPPHKLHGAIAAAEDRLAMVILAITGNAAFETRRTDVDRPGPSYTADTVALLAAEVRGRAGTPDLTLIMSSETLDGLPSWRDPGRLLEACRVAVVPREDRPLPATAWLASRFPGLEDRFDLLDGPRLAISSTGIRARVAAGRSIRYLVPDAVERYIHDHGLYSGPRRSPQPPPPPTFPRPARGPGPPERRASPAAPGSSRAPARPPRPLNARRSTSRGGSSS